MTIAIGVFVFVFVFVAILDIHGWINVWKEARVKVAEQKILEQTILPAEGQKRTGLFNAAIYPAHN